MKGLLTLAAWFLIYGVALVVGVGITGLVLATSWNWFIAPIAGLRLISWSEAIGLMFFLGSIGAVITAPVRQWDFKTDPEDSVNAIAAKGFGKILGALIVGPLVGLVVSWAWHTFIVAQPGY